MTGFEPMEENLRATLAMFTQAKERGEARAYPGVSIAYSAVQFSMFNSAILTAPVRSAEELDRRIKTAHTHFSARHSPWSFWVCEGWVAPEVRSKVGEIFSRNGLHLVTELPGMEAERVLRPAGPLAALEYRRVDDVPSRVAFNHIMAVAFGIPHSVAREIYEAERTWTGDFAGYLGFVDGLAVASAATLTAAEVIGVYAVGTLPSHQRRGYAEAVMRYALEQAQRATCIERSVLQSSDAGFHLYERMGYRTIARYAVFAYS